VRPEHTLVNAGLEEFLSEFIERLDVLVDDLVVELPFVHELPGQELQGVGMERLKIGPALEEGLDVGLPIQPLHLRGNRKMAERLHQALDDGQVEELFGLEMVEEEPLGDACSFGDLAGARADVPFSGENFLGDA
jgi:hypothetical protein